MRAKRLSALFSLPAVLQRIAAVWFWGSTAYTVISLWTVIPTGVFLAGCFLLFCLLTAATARWPLLALDARMLGASAVSYGGIFLLCRTGAADYALCGGVILALAVVLLPLLRSPKPLLPPCRRVPLWGIAAVCAVAFFAVVGTVGILRYLTFSTPNYDFGIFCHMFHHMKTDLLPLVTSERNQLLSHFAVHISPIYYVMLPLYVIFPSPITLQLSQAAVLASGVIPLVLLGKHFRLSARLCAVLCVFYALYPTLSTGCFYDLHENCFLTPLLLWLFWCYEAGHFRWMTVSAVGVLAVKEDAAVYLLIFGFWLLCERRDYRRSLPLMLGGAIYFAAAVLLLQHFGTGAMFGRYGALLSAEGENGGIVGAILHDPGYFLKELTAAETLDRKLKYMFAVLCPFGVLLWSPRRATRLLLLSPLLLNLLTRYAYQSDVGFQYTFGITAFLLYAFVQGLAEQPPHRARNAAVFGTVCALMLYCLLVIPKLATYTARWEADRDTYATMCAILETVPDDASVTASTMLVPHLCGRDTVYETAYHPTPDTDCVVLDLRAAYAGDADAYRAVCYQNGYRTVTRTDGAAEVLIHE